MAEKKVQVKYWLRKKVEPDFRQRKKVKAKYWLKKKFSQTFG